MTFLSRTWQRLKRWFIWFGKAVLLTVFAGVLTWAGLQAWQLWNGHQQGELIQVKLVNENSKVTEAELTELLRPQLGIGFWQLDSVGRKSSLGSACGSVAVLAEYLTRRSG
jgi:H+/Cl- antiporter ClcA